MRAYQLIDEQGEEQDKEHTMVLWVHGDQPAVPRAPSKSGRSPHYAYYDSAWWRSR